MKRNRARSRVALAVCLALGAALALSACAPGGSGGSSAGTGAPVSTDVAGAGKVTLTLTDFWKSAEGDWIDQVIKDFEKKYPNVTIKRTSEDWGQLNSTLNLQLQDAKAPDIATANNGWQGLGTLAKGGLILNLDKYADAYGWNTSVPSSIARQNKFTTDFKTMGSGSWYAAPVARTSNIGLYYNADKLNKLGIDKPPTTLAELNTDAAKAKAAGEIPFAYAGMDSNTAALLGVQATMADKDKLNNYIYDDTSVTASDIKMTEAVTQLKKWYDEGYFPSGFQGLDGQTVMNDFVNGQGVFHWEYTGALGLNATQQKHFGYTQLTQADGQTVGVGSAPAAMVISSKCKNPDVAAAFLNFLMSETSAQAAADLGLTPALDANVAVNPNSLSLTGESDGAKALEKDNGYVPYIDWSSPTMLDTIGQNLQLVYAGKMTPAAFTKAVDADRATFLKQQG